MLPARNNRQLTMQLANAFLPYVPAIMNSGSNLVRGMYQQVQQRALSPPPQPPPKAVRAKTNKRRRARLNKRVVGTNAARNGILNLDDTEQLTTTTGSLQALEFGHGSLTRLSKFFELFGEYRFLSVVVTTTPLVNSTKAEAFAMGVYVGGKSDKIVDADTISKLTPSKYMAAGVASITVPQTILRAHNMLSVKSPFFTLYLLGKSGHVSVKVHYKILMASPTPF